MLTSFVRVLGRRLVAQQSELLRCYSKSAALVIDDFGVPEKVLKLHDYEVPSPDKLGDNEVLINILAVRLFSFVSFLSLFYGNLDFLSFLPNLCLFPLLTLQQAPINPSDINTIEGKYPLRPALPASPGHEGVGIVKAIGQKVTRLRPGDRCVPIEHSQGTWRTHGVFQEHHWYRIPHDLPIATASSMVINPPTALRLLEEYAALNPGDSIIQTGATSAVGKYILQLAHQKEIKTINVIRDRPDRGPVERELRELGATAIVTPSEVAELMKTWEYPPPKLALDCVGGEASTAAVKALA